MQLVIRVVYLIFPFSSIDKRHGLYAYRLGTYYFRPVSRVPKFKQAVIESWEGIRITYGRTQPVIRQVNGEVEVSV